MNNVLKRNEKLIRTKLIQYLAPAIMTNLALQVGNIVDTILKMAFITGVPACLSIVCEMVRNSSMNVMILRFIGESGDAIYTICLNVVLIVELFIGGIVGAMEKIGGVVYGEKDYFGLRAITKNILVYSYTLLAILLLILFILQGRQPAYLGSMMKDFFWRRRSPCGSFSLPCRDTCSTGFSFRTIRRPSTAAMPT